MKKIWLGTSLMLGLLAYTAGCAQNARLGNSGQWTGQYFGDVGVVGHGNTLLIQRGSRVWKLSIQGDNNFVTVEEGVTLNRIEFWGNGNTVSIPENLMIRETEIGGNQVIRRHA